MHHVRKPGRNGPLNESATVASRSTDVLFLLHEGWGRTATHSRIYRGRFGAPYTEPREEIKVPILRIEQSIPDYAGWKAMFDKDPEDRKGSGVRRYTVFRSPADERYVLIDLEFGTTQEAEGFLKKLEAFWAGPGKAVHQNPRGRIVEIVDTKEV